jgi:DNA-binding transcriptional LysR family regulator
MRAPTNLDMDVLRSFATGIALGSFAKAADRLGRSPSAVSLQLRKLEEQAGANLVRKQGRGLALTEAGETMLSYARRILDLNDEGLAAVRGAAVAGWVRLGLSHDFAEGLLPLLLGRLARAHPNVRIEARVERVVDLVDAILGGRLDLALAWGDGTTPFATKIAELPIAWIGPAAGFARRDGEELPLVIFESPCVFRDPAVRALDAAGIAWRRVFTSPSLTGLYAAVDAGLGVTVRTAAALPPRLAALDPGAANLPPLPDIALALHTAEKDPPPAVRWLAAMLRETLAGTLPPARLA